MIILSSTKKSEDAQRLIEIINSLTSWRISWEAGKSLGGVMFVNHYRTRLVDQKSWLNDESCITPDLNNLNVSNR
jgi:hypothetical protein